MALSYIAKRGFFDNVDHEWLIKFLEHDIADKKFIEIIKKFRRVSNRPYTL